ncbi:MAG: hypothetical protein ACJAS4_002940 [Bacteriovoracaceae bacterium]|jgi:hypothetical protein
MSKFLILLFFFFHVGFTSEVFAAKKKKGKTKALIQTVFTKFEDGKYEEVITTLDKLEKRIKPNSKQGKKIKGLVYYWKAMSYSRLNDFDIAETFFIKALEQKYFSKDIYYEYGQVLYVSLKYKRARVAFKKSVKAKYKIGVSLYYIAFISQELKDYKKAVSFYNMIEKLPSAESKDVIQAARMQIGDIYLKQIERQRDPFRGVEKYVIPQYKKAHKYDEESKLAEEIRDKIENLQRKYELILFKMRNGKQTSRPPYYVRANILYGQNDNVTRISEDNKDAAEEKDYSSSYYEVGVFSRYSFYPNSAFSYAPEFSAQLTQFSSDSVSILPSNKYFIKGALKMNYEHLYKTLPATFYMDFDYTYNADDAAAEEEFAASNNTYGATFSEELQLFANNPSTFRFRYESLAAEEETGSSSTLTLSYEQVVLLKRTTLFFTNSYAMTSMSDSDSESLNTNTLTSRLDAILPSVYNLFNPSLYVSLTNTDYTEDSDKGVLSLTTLGMNLNRPVGRHLYLTLDYSVGTQTADLDDDNYTQQLITLNLDLIY